MFDLQASEIDIEVSLVRPIFSGEQLTKWYIQCILTLTFTKSLLIHNICVSHVLKGVSGFTIVNINFYVSYN